MATKHQLFDFNTISSHEYSMAEPQVATIGDKFCIIGTSYGHIRTTSGDVRTWKTRSGARKFLNQYLSQYLKSQQTQ